MDTTLNLTFNNQHIIFHLLIFLVSFGIAYLSYKEPNPPITRRLKYFLLTLRSLILALVIGALLEPLLSIINKYNEEPVVAVLIDQSESMEIDDVPAGPQSSADMQKRIEVAAHLVYGKNGISPALDEKSEVKVFGFAKNAEPVTNSVIKNTRSETNIGQALKFVDDALVEHNLTSIILITDGSNNSGIDPVRQAAGLKAPVYTIGVGDPTERKDISISRFLTNETAYVDNDIPVEVTIRSNGFDNTKIPVQIFWADKLMAEDFLILKGNSMEQKIVLHFVPTEPGDHKFTLKIPVQKDEFITQNNNRDFVVKVLKNKIQILQIAGRPSYDFSFLQRYMKRDQNVETTSFILKRDGTFSLLKDSGVPKFNHLPRTEAEINEFDIVLLMDIQRRNLGDKFEALVKDFVNIHGGALIMLGGEDSFGNGGYQTSPLNEILPVSMKMVNKLKTGSFPLQFTTISLNHALTQLDDNQEVSQRIWQSLPPITGYNTTEARPGAEILATVENNFPAIAIQRFGKGKVMAMPITSFWQWDFLMVGVQGNNKYSDRFWSNSIRWLVSRDDINQVNLTTDKRIYRSGESVNFAIQVYDETFKPVDLAEVKVFIQNTSDNDAKTEVIALEKETGNYVGVMENLMPGDYKALATATKGSIKFGRDEETFTISEYSLEFENTQAYEPLLREIAQASNGNYYRPSEMDQLVNSVKLTERVKTTSYDIVLWDHPWLFFSLIILLCFEWIMRKRQGLA